MRRRRRHRQVVSSRSVRLAAVARLVSHNPEPLALSSGFSARITMHPSPGGLVSMGAPALRHLSRSLFA